MKDDNSFSELITKLFYDILAYVVPGLFILVGILYLFGYIQVDSFRAITINLKIYVYEISNNFFVSAFIIVITISTLYLIGQLLTTLSARIITRLTLSIFCEITKNFFPLKREQYTQPINELIHLIKEYNYKNFRTNLLTAQILVPNSRFSITKRQARLAASRNMALVSIILFIINLCNNKQFGLIFLLLFFIFFLDSTIRYFSLDNHVLEILEIKNIKSE